MRIRHALVYLLLSSVAAVGLRADQITLKNGDHITGAIVKKDGGTLTITSAQLGKVTVPWDQVDTLTTDVPAHIQIGGVSEVGTVNLSGGQLTITATGGTTRSVSVGDVQAIRNDAEQAAYERLQNPAWFQLWGGNANLGFAGTAGNARTKTLTVASTAARSTMTDKASLHFDAVSASALVGGVDTATAKAVRGGWAYQRNISPKVFVFVFNDYEFDRFQSLDLRFVLGAGGGYHVVQNDRTKLDLLAGIDYDHATFSTPLTRNAAEFSWGDDFNQKLNKTVTLVQSYRMFSDLQNFSDYRVNFDFGASVHLAQWLTWNVTLSDRYVSNPVAGRLNNDLLYSTGLGVTFGQ